MSTPAVGSSKINIGGLCTKAFAINSLLLIPPESALAYECITSTSPTFSKISKVLRSRLGTPNKPAWISNAS